MKLLVDMNLSPRWVHFLAEAGIRAVHRSEIGHRDAPDEVLLDWAAENGCILLTCDLDFGAILAATRRLHPSVVQIRSDRQDPEAVGAALVTALHEAKEALQSGALLSVDPLRARLRILPLPGRPPT